ncbi:UxaA family hydrolase [Halosolutus halophilus]|uniref:UxaA family hydrolase n=1 Tax=Halosolutus halophilus TaxID=1552990 RepID=UPI0022352FCE|nr:UxaA family hydrolase [Halosolutus halophilus]
MGDSHIVAVESDDNVATAIRELNGGETVTVDVGDNEVTVEVAEDVTFGHKIALEDIPEGETVYKYGLSIGYASRDIEAGEWVHAHNVESNYGRGDLAEETA